MSPTTTPAAGRRYLAPTLPLWSVRGLAAATLALGLALPRLAPHSGLAALKPPAPPELVEIRPKLVKLPAGEFLMGSPDGVGTSDERPQRRVSVASFWLCQTEVTQGQWQAVMGGNPSDGGGSRGANYPVNNVSWFDTLVIRMPAQTRPATNRQTSFANVCRSNNK